MAPPCIIAKQDSEAAKIDVTLLYFFQKKKNNYFFY